MNTVLTKSSTATLDDSQLYGSTSTPSSFEALAASQVRCGCLNKARHDGRRSMKREQLEGKEGELL